MRDTPRLDQTRELRLPEQQRAERQHDEVVRRVVRPDELPEPRDGARRRLVRALELLVQRDEDGAGCRRFIELEQCQERREEGELTFGASERASRTCDCGLRADEERGNECERDHRRPVGTMTSKCQSTSVAIAAALAAAQSSAHRKRDWRRWLLGPRCARREIELVFDFFARERERFA
ncbi:MAG: hypothetical protein V9E82_04145 [Candidatus Nanopelagicales bacterium]